MCPVPDLSLVGGTVVTMDDAGTILPRGTVIIHDGLVEAVLDGEVRHGEVLDCRGRLVIPGLVNIHAHTMESLFRGAGGDLGLLRWIAERSHPLTAALDDAGTRAAARLAALEMLRSGTTAFLDPEVAPSRSASVAEAVAATGLRGALAIAVGDGAGYGGHGHQHETPGYASGTVEDISELLDRQLDQPRVSFWLGPRVLSAMSPHLGAAISHAAASHDTGVTFHCAEIPEDVAAVRGSTGLSPGEHADAIGLLGPRSVIAHGVHLGAGDLDILGRSGTHVAHCPTSNAKLGAGIAPVLEMRERGINVGLGTDGGMCNDTYDILAEMRLAALLQRASHAQAGAMTANTVLEMATVSGARAMGLPAGQLSPGLLGDCVVIDLRRYGSWPTVDPVHSLVFGSGRAAVQGVIVGGEVRVANGELTGIDAAAVLRDAEEAAGAAIERSGIRAQLSPSWWPTDAMRAARG